MTTLIDFAAEAARRGRHLRVVDGALTQAPVVDHRSRESAALARLYQRLRFLRAPRPICVQAEEAAREAVRTGATPEQAYQLGVTEALSLMDDDRGPGAA
ncbi:hypothetical protein [Halorhodospira sp. 9622]|uniref:hypothetical protein n=1 Tax=Halorhodospira sp. 9622 TaxID=2899136 RepID=UPI001EE85F86|nr:hypothetical protein [Halorhodospira sp. 9622]MCG5538986.1 hypothetical protein [Halorhodospira sp. 9622]